MTDNDIYRAAAIIDRCIDDTHIEQLTLALSYLIAEKLEEVANELCEINDHLTEM